MQEAIYTPVLQLQLPLPLSDDPGFVWHLANPQGLFRSSLLNCEPMREFIRLNYRQGSFWSMIFYHDEVTPGNIAAPQNLRKFVGFYFSFREFGNELLHHGCMWMRFGVLRIKDVIDKLPGRFFTCMRDGFGPHASQWRELLY